MCLFSARAKDLDENKPRAAALLRFFPHPGKACQRGKSAAKRWAKKEKGNIFQAERLSSRTLRSAMPPAMSLNRAPAQPAAHGALLHVLLDKIFAILQTPFDVSLPMLTRSVRLQPASKGIQEKNVDALLTFLCLWQTPWSKATDRREGIFQLAHLGRNPPWREARPATPTGT